MKVGDVPRSKGSRILGFTARKAPHRTALAARVCDAVETPVRIQHHRLGTAHPLSHLKVMPAISEGFLD